MKLLFCLMILLLAMAPPVTFVSTYYVSTSGSDSNAGTEAAPFRTIQKAASVVSAGDTVIVAAGTYTGNNLCSGDNAIVCLTRGGSISAHVTFQSATLYGAKLVGAGNNAGFRYTSSSNYVDLEGFEISGIAAIAADGGASAIQMYSGGKGSTIKRVSIHDIGYVCTDTTKGQNGIFVQQPSVTVERTAIYNVGRKTPLDGCTYSTTNFQNHDHGIYLNGTNESTAIPGGNGAVIKNNLFYNNKRGWSIQLYPGSLSSVVVANNTFAFENPYREGHIIIGANLTSSTISNNVFFDPLTYALNFYSGTMSSVSITNNITYSGTLKNKTPSGVTFTSNSDNTNPGLTDATNNDFSLLSNSVAIDSGGVISGVTDDFVGASRPQGAGYDVGAYEYGGIAPSPTPTPAPTPVPTPTPSLPSCTNNQLIGTPATCTCSGQAIGKPKRCRL